MSTFPPTTTETTVPSDPRTHTADTLEVDNQAIPQSAKRGPSRAAVLLVGCALSVSSSADGQLDIDADTDVEITATTIDINGAVEISGASTQTGISTSAAIDVFNAGMSVKNGSSSAGFVEFFENSGNGTNKATLIGPASTSDVTLTLPAVTDTVAVSGDITALAIALG